VAALPPPISSSMAPPLAQPDFSLPVVPAGFLLAAEDGQSRRLLCQSSALAFIHSFACQLFCLFSHLDSGCIKFRFIICYELYMFN
jgi:hypothetical protein